MGLWGIVPLTIIGCTVDDAVTLHISGSGLCMSAADKVNDTPLRQVACSGDESQQFRFIPYAGSYLVTHVESGKCLDVADWSVQDGARIQLWTCHGGDNQRFAFGSRGGSDFEMRSVLSDKCVSVSGGSTASGAEMVQRTCDDGADQTLYTHVEREASPDWGRLVDPAGGESQAIRGAFFFTGSDKSTLGHTYTPKESRHLAWDADPLNRAYAVDRISTAGVNVIFMSTWGRGAELDATNTWAPTWVTETSRDQLFDLAHAYDVQVAPVIETTIPHFTLVNRATLSCLHVPGASWDSGVALEESPCVYGNWDYQFRVQKPHWVDENDSNPSDDTYREIRVHESAKCLDVRAYGTADGTPVQQWDCTDAANQVFNMEPVDAVEETFRFRDTFSGKCLTLNLSGKLVIMPCDTGYEQQFYVHNNVGDKATWLIWEKRYSTPDELGRLEVKASPAPYLEDQVTALVEHYITGPAHSYWPDTWSRVYDRKGSPRYLVYLMFAKSSDTRLRDNDWKWAEDLQQTADNVYDRTGVRIGFTLDTAPGPDYGHFRQYYNVTSMASAPALWRHDAFLGIQPYSPESFMGDATVSDVDRTDTKRQFYEDWIRTGLPVILGMVPYYRVHSDLSGPPDPPLFGTTDQWIDYQTQMLRDLDVQGVMYTAWNGYDEGYAGVVGANFHHNPNATPLATYDRFYLWAMTLFSETAAK